MADRLKRNLFFFFYLSSLTSCGASYQSKIDEYASLLNEEELCESSMAYPAGATLIGTATFEKRTIDVATEDVGTTTPNVRIRTMSLGDPVATPLAIRFAEVIVYDAFNHRVQCGVTDASGNLKALDGISDLKIPNSSGSYHVKVLSRSTYDSTFVSVKRDKYRNEVHSVNASFNVTGSETISVSLNARARQTDSTGIEGGAFNILNSIQTAFEYVKANTGALDTSCLSEKLNVYWIAGFNPVQYQSPNSDPQTLGNTSYYLSSTKELFISGGQIGDVSLSNTDHFDDFAIIHELGHFIEDHCGQWTSPGGNHTLTHRIDQRLAWSEGWSNFFAAHVIQNKLSALDASLPAKFSSLTNNFGWTHFFNSFGFSDSFQNISNGEGFVIDLSRAGTDPGTYQFAPYTGQEFDRVLPNSYPGEGHTREGAISRGLFKISNTCTLCATTPITFEEIWDSYRQVSALNNPFIGSHTIFEKLKTVSGSWTTGVASVDETRAEVVDKEALHLKSELSFGASPLLWPGYGSTLVNVPGCDLRIQPRSDGSLNNSSSDQRYSNHFYTIDFSTLPNLSFIKVTLSYNSGSNVDHDLILFKPGYFFNDDYSCSAYTNGSCTSFIPNRNSTNSDIFVMNRTPASTLNTSYNKRIDLTGIDKTQKYLLDIRAWTAGISIASNTSYTYTIEGDMGVLCPQ